MENQTKRERIIQALKNSDIKALEALNENTVYVGTFLDFMKVGSLNKNERDKMNIIYLKTTFTEFLETLSDKNES